MIQQRLGETFEEFEKRKRRVKLQSVPFGDMFAHGGGYIISDVAYTNCYDSLTNSLTVWGYIDSTLGALTPDTTSDGTLIYQATFDTSDGAFIMSFGALGTTQLFADEAETNEIRQIIKEFSAGNVELFWNSTNSRYEGTNQSLATSLALLTGTQVCFADIAIPDKLIDINFAQLEEQV